MRGMREVEVLVKEKRFRLPIYEKDGDMGLGRDAGWGLR